MADLLKITDLGVRFRALSSFAALLQNVKDPWIDAVLDVSLRIAPCETVALVGESGSGNRQQASMFLCKAKPRWVDPSLG